MTKRDYRLLESQTEPALTIADWYHTEVPKDALKTLMARSDHPAIRDTLLLYGLMIACLGLGVVLWPSWWSAPFWLIYGVLYTSASDARWHECGHSTAFRTRWMNTVVYHIACFMIIRNPVSWRFSHIRHHSDTIIVGRDPEIALMRPVRIARALLQFIGIPDMIDGLANMALNATGRLRRAEATYIPLAQHHRVVRIARVWTAIYAGVIALAIGMGSILPLMVVGLPRLYGAWHFVMTGYLQHGGLDENVLDHRLNSRSVLMNPVSRFIYWNMNYHVEHHMFPMVPYHQLPALHELIKHDLPAPSPSIWAAYREALPAIWRQLRDPDYKLERQLPATAKAYRPDLPKYAD